MVKVVLHLHALPHFHAGAKGLGEAVGHVSRDAGCARNDTRERDTVDAQLHSGIGESDRHSCTNGWGGLCVLMQGNLYDMGPMCVTMVEVALTKLATHAAACQLGRRVGVGVRWQC